MKKRKSNVRIQWDYERSDLILTTTFVQILMELFKKYIKQGAQYGGLDGGGWSNKYYKTSKLRLKRFFNYLVKHKKQSFFDVIELFLTKLKGLGYTKKTRKDYLSLIRSAIKYWVKRGRLPVELLNSFAHIKIKLGTYAPKDKKCFTGIELDKINTSSLIPKGRRLIYRFAYETGYRVNEIKSLDVKDFDDKKNEITLEAKNAKNRKDHTATISKSLSKELNNYISTGEALSQYKKVFKGNIPNNIPKYPIFYLTSQPSQTLKKDLIKLGITPKDPEGKLTMHSFRITLNNKLFELGFSLNKVMELMRHSDPRLSACVYSRTEKEFKQKVPELLYDIVKDDNSKDDNLSGSNLKIV